MATADSAALDDFLNRFRAQVDSGFGLIAGDVGLVFGSLVVISVGLSALLWALDDTQSVTAVFVRKVLLVGTFAWLVSSWHGLATTVVEGFTALGLKAGAGSLTIAGFLEAPSKVVGDGFKDAFALIAYIGRLSQQGAGLGFFANFDVILVAAVTAIGLILAFIVLGVEVAVTIIEFHVVTLIAFVTVPFGVLSHTAFIGERALGYVVSVGIKLMALALVVSIGETVFESYTVSADPTIGEECGLLLSGVLMLMLALKIPAIAGALISGGPQLSAGSTVAAAAGLAAVVGGAALAGRTAGAMVARGMAGGAEKVAAARAASNLPPPAGPPPGAPGPDGGPTGGGGPHGGAPAGEVQAGDLQGAADLVAGLRRSPVQAIVEQLASRRLSAPVRAESERTDPPLPAPPAQDPVAAARRRGVGGLGGVGASEAAFTVAREHEAGAGAGLAARLRPQDDSDKSGEAAS